MGLKFVFQKLRRMAAMTARLSDEFRMRPLSIVARASGTARPSYICFRAPRRPTMRSTSTPTLTFSYQGIFGLPALVWIPSVLHAASYLPRAPQNGYPATQTNRTPHFERSLVLVIVASID